MADDLDFGSTIRGYSPGQKVFGRYTLQKILGRGGMGVVWLARDEELEREVALKFLPEVVAADQQAIRDLKRETRRSLELTHPHIIRIYDFVQDAHSAAISMEYVAGDTLASLKLEQPGEHFEAEQLSTWIEQLCQALDYAHHTAEVVHRDLKPANLMVDARGNLKIADFGIAASVSDSVSRVSVQAGSSGTPVYMSPQQMMGEKPAISDDIYALGATLYDLLTGRPPFYSGNVMMQVMNKTAPTMTERRVDLEVPGNKIPSAWEETVGACLAKEAIDRPVSMAALAAQLRGESVAEHLSGSPAAAPPAVPAEVATTQAPVSKPASAPATPSEPSVSSGGGGMGKWLGLAAAMALLGGGAGWWFGIEQPKRQAEAAQIEAARIAQEREAQAQRDEAARLAALRIPVQIGSTPSGARVFVDGREVGRTPWTNPGGLALGDYQIELQLEGYDTIRDTLEVSENTLSLMMTLERASGTLRWNVEPADATFWLHDEGPTFASDSMADAEGVVGDGTLELPTGTYWGYVANPARLIGGEITQNVEVTVMANEESSINADLRAAELQLATDAGSSSRFALYHVREDGDAIQVTRGMLPVTLDVAPGVYRVETFRESHGTKQTGNLTLHAGQSTTFEAHLLGPQLRIESTPAGAIVRDENGDNLGTTPLVVEDLARGSTPSFTMELEGYQSAKRTLTEQETRFAISGLTWEETLRERPPYELRADFRRGPTRLRFSIDTDMTTRTTTSTNGGAPDVSAPTQSSTAAEVEIHDLVYGSSGNIVGLTQPEKEMSNGVEMYLPNTRVRYERRGNVWTNRFLGGGFKLETMKSEYLQPFYPGVWLDDITLPPGVPEVGRTWDVPLSHSKLMFGSMRLETTDGYIRGRVSDANLTGSPAWAEIEFSYRLSGPMKSWVPDSPMRMRILGEGTLKLRINLDEHYVLGGEWLTTNTVNSKMTGAFNIDTEAVVTSKNIITVTPLEWGNGRPQVARNGATATGSSNSTTPPQVIVRIAPAYPRRALMRGIEGTTTVGITVGPTGAVEDVSIRESSGDSSLDDAAIVAARKWKFTPAMEGDHPIKALTTQRITFKLEN